MFSFDSSTKFTYVDDNHHCLILQLTERLFQFIQVSNFATEFLKRKDGQPSAPSAAAVTGGANGSSGSVVKKKGKKGNTEF